MGGQYFKVDDLIHTPPPFQPDPERTRPAAQIVQSQPLSGRESTGTARLGLCRLLALEQLDQRCDE